MILKKGANMLCLDEQCEQSTVSAYIYSAGIERTSPNGHWFALCQITIQQMREYKLKFMRQGLELQGFPTSFAIAEDHKTFEFIPINDIDREVRIRYNPIAKEV